MIILKHKIFSKLWLIVASIALFIGIRDAITLAFQPSSSLFIKIFDPEKIGSSYLDGFILVAWNTCLLYFVIDSIRKAKRNSDISNILTCIIKVVYQNKYCNEKYTSDSKLSESIIVGMFELMEEEVKSTRCKCGMYIELEGSVIPYDYILSQYGKYISLQSTKH